MNFDVHYHSDREHDAWHSRQDFVRWRHWGNRRHWLKANKRCWLGGTSTRRRKTNRIESWTFVAPLHSTSEGCWPPKTTCLSRIHYSSVTSVRIHYCWNQALVYHMALPWWSENEISPSTSAMELPIHLPWCRPISVCHFARSLDRRDSPEFGIQVEDISQGLP